MSGDFQYRPRFVDIRVRPPKPGEAEAENDVHALKPGEKPCDFAGCRAAATARAPKSRELMHEHYWFCQAHAAEYNKQWNFFSGMSDDQVAAAQAARITGERPTWSFKASNRSRDSAAATHNPQGFADPFSLFGFAKSDVIHQHRADGRQLGKMERGALADLDLPETAVAAEIKTRYHELLKRCHPDSNGGDRSAEHKLQRVIQAWKTLKKAKLA
ncbi:MAG: DnaJ domain-containing protein [Caulobacter sp.]|nr:DnaJ domain-containing protein [Caulobacter sp.]